MGQNHSVKPTLSRAPNRAIVSVLVVVAIALATSSYTFWRLDSVKANLEVSNQFYVPTLKALNLLQGQWSAYQKAFEQYVGFRHWGNSAMERGAPKPHLNKMIETSFSELSQILQKDKNSIPLEIHLELQRLSDLFSTILQREPGRLAETATLVKAKRFSEAAAAYTATRQEHLEISQSLANLNARIENTLSEVQFATEEELRNSETIFVIVLSIALVLTVFVLFRLRRWIMPVVRLTKVAQEVSLKGINGGIAFPEYDTTMPPEIGLLTREFSRMGVTVLEREKTIYQQKAKLEALNNSLKEQNELLRKSEAKLEHAKKLVLAANMSAQIAHEVRNPLNSISLQLEMLEEDIGGTGKGNAITEKRLQAISEQIQRLERITSRYLEVKQGLSLRKEKIDLHLLIERNIEFLSTEFQRFGVIVELSLKAQKPFILGDGDALSQVLLNLIRNSLDSISIHQSGVKKIKIETYNNDNGMLSVCISDTGKGVSEIISSKMFEPFITDKSQGHGLGLSVSRQICIEHGGELFFKGPLDGSGAVFEFLIPSEYNMSKGSENVSNPSC